jgi:hypothetical protein
MKFLLGFSIFLISCDIFPWEDCVKRSNPVSWIGTEKFVYADSFQRLIPINNSQIELLASSIPEIDRWSDYQAISGIGYLDPNIIGNNLLVLQEVNSGDEKAIFLVFFDQFWEVKSSYLLAKRVSSRDDLEIICSVFSKDSTIVQISTFTDYDTNLITSDTAFFKLF